MTDYTTLQYHLANKTHIGFIIKLISGIVGVILNIVLIPKMGLVGVGLATLAANFLFWLLSAVIVVPNLNIKVPKRMILRLFITFVPTVILAYLLKTYVGIIPGTVQMLILLILFYGFYYLAVRKWINFAE